MTWQDNYPRMLRRNRATGFAICHCLLRAFTHRQYTCRCGITEEDISLISHTLLVSERWIKHVLLKYGLFHQDAAGYFPVEGWETEVSSR